MQQPLMQILLEDYTLETILLQTVTIWNLTSHIFICLEFFIFLKGRQFYFMKWF